MPTHLVLILITSTPSTLEQENTQRKIIDWMKAFHIDHKTIDGADQVNKELRNELFDISKLKGKYPQVFLTNKTDSTVYVGDYEKIQSLIEDNNLPADVLAKNNLPTFNSVFANAKN